MGGPGTNTVWIRENHCAPLQGRGKLYHLTVKDYKHKKAGRWENPGWEVSLKSDVPLAWISVCGTV